MLDFFKSIPGTVKSWREDRDYLLPIVAGLSATLVVISALTKQRPSDLLSTAAQSFGITPIADWFDEDAPPILAAADPIMQKGLLWTALCLFAWMTFVPLVQGMKLPWELFGYVPLRLLDAPVASTIWILLLIAAQQGDITDTLVEWGAVALDAVPWALGMLVVGVIIYFVGSRYSLGWLVITPLAWGWSLGRRVAWCLVCAVIAVIGAAVSLPLSLLGWMCALETQHARNVRAKVEAERDVKPSGAISTLRPRSQTS